MDDKQSTFTFSRRGFLGGGVLAGAALFAGGAFAGANLGLFDLGIRDTKPHPPDPPPGGPPAPHHGPRGSALTEISRTGVASRLAIMSDLHLDTKTNAAMDKYVIALQTLGWVAPGIDAFFMLGDVGLNGTDNELETFATFTAEKLQSIYRTAPLTHLMMGNHDYLEGTKESFETAFEKHRYASNFVAQQNTVTRLEGVTIIKLNGEGSPEVDVMDYTVAYDFLAQSLAEAAEHHPSDAILVMAHEPPQYMELPAYYECGYFGQDSELDMIKLMQKYPQVRMFSGHVHNNLDKGNSINTDLEFVSVHTSTVGSCYFYKGFFEDKHEIGSQGLLLDVMEDGRLVLHLLDFDTQEELGEPVEI